MQDRFARPEQAPEAVLLQQKLQSAGLTIVFSTGVFDPRQKGKNYIAEDITNLMSYSESGEFLNKLAVRVIEAQTSLARQGHWTGGQPPYGFIRVRVDASGNEIEMLPGTSIRSSGYHTEVRPKDPDKIRIWLMIHDWYTNKKWGDQANRPDVESVRNTLAGCRTPSPRQSWTAAGAGHLDSRHHRVTLAKWSVSGSVHIRRAV